MSAFDDLLDANRHYAEAFELEGIPGAAARGLGIVTCMDARIDPLAILGLQVGDAKIVRNPGGQVTDQALEAMVLATHLLDVDRILVIQHTRCAMASHSREQLQEKVSASAGQPVDAPFGAIADQQAHVRADVERLQQHPLIPDTVAVGGFVYDVDTGLLEQIV